ncbi:MAG: FmdB family zinc ribbon protein [Candidatus Promineifilaceae bacterium]
MPIYEYRCAQCGRKLRLFFSYAEYDAASPACTYCGKRELRRLISRVALGTSEESRLDAMDDDALLSGLDEEDPRSLGRFMRKMSNEMGEDMGGEFDEVIDRLESGQSPEDIEKSMPELAADEGGASFGGDDDF